MALGDQAGAVKSYRAQQQVLSRMADGDPDRGARQSDPAVLDITTGSVPAAQGHLAQHGLAQHDLAQHDLAQHDLARDDLARDHLAEVLTSQQASLASMERVAKANLA